VYDKTQATCLVDNLTAELSARLTWPIRDIAIDDAGELLAFHCSNDEVLIFSRTSRRFLDCLLRYPDDHPAIEFAFERLPTAQGLEQYFLLITSGGRSITLRLNDTAAPEIKSLSETPLLGTSIVNFEGHGKRLFTVSEDARLTSYSWESSFWAQCTSSEPQSTLHLEFVSGTVSIEPFPDSEDDIVIVSSGPWVYLVDVRGLTVITTLHTVAEGQKARLVLGQRTRCDACGSIALQGLAVASEKSKPQDLIIDVRGSEAIASEHLDYCLKGLHSICNTIHDSSQTTHNLPNPGAWHALSSHTILGIRKRLPSPPPSPLPSPSQLRHRRSARSQHLIDSAQDEWEAYSLPLTGELKTLDISTSSPSGEADQALYVTKPGPAAALDSQSVAIAFGNCIKVLKASAPRGSSGLGRAGAADRSVNPVTSRRRGTGSGRKML
jgi:hypothetical protein